MIGSRLARGATRTVLGLILASTCTQAAVSQAIAEEYDPGMEVFDVVIDDGGVTEAQVEPVATDPTVIDGEVVQPTEEQVYDPEAEAARMAALAAAPAPPLAEAQGAAIVDGGGNILWQKNGDQRMSPASTTKVMTAVVALDALKNGISLDDQVSLVAPDLGPEAQMADYANGEQAVLRDMLRVMLVYSANDAAYNVARHVAGVTSCREHWLRYASISRRSSRCQEGRARTSQRVSATTVSCTSLTLLAMGLRAMARSRSVRRSSTATATPWSANRSSWRSR